MSIRIKFICPALLLVSSALAQEKMFSGPTVYVEAFGNGAGITLNAEKVLFKTGKRFGAGHIGYGTFKKQSRDHENEYYWKSIPIGLSLFNGYGNHHSDMGLSITYVEGMDDTSVDVQTNPGEFEVSQSLYFIPNFGYRLQKPDGGFFLRFYLSPMFKLKEFADSEELKKRGNTHFSLGLSLGYSFSNKGKG